MLAFLLFFNSGITLQWVVWKGSHKINAGSVYEMDLNYPISTSMDIPIPILQSFNQGLRLTIAGAGSVPYTTLHITVRNWNSSNAVTLEVFHCLFLDVDI